MTFRKVGAVILLVSDMEKSIRFYRDTLGIPIKIKSKAWTEFFNKDTVLALHPAKKKSKMKTTCHTMKPNFHRMALNTQ